MSIRNSFNLSQIINAANEAGAAAKFGELEKDNRHDDSSRRSFLPIGGGNVWSIWSTHSLEVIKFIAKRSSLLNGQTLPNSLQLA